MDSSSWSELLRWIVEDLWRRYGPFSALFVVLIGLHAWLVHRLYTARIKDKDQEIERLVAQRDRLQDVVLENRVSSVSTADHPHQEEAAEEEDARDADDR